MSNPHFEALIKEIVALLNDSNLTKDEREEAIKGLAAGNSPAIMADRIRQRRQNQALNGKGAK